jgi:hypothetical protein
LKTLATLLLISLKVAAGADHSELPSPTGPHTIGTTKFIWTDASRVDAEPGVEPRPRQLIVQLWYPAARSTQTRAPYMLEYEALKRALNAEPEFASKSAAFSSIVTSASLDALLAPSHRAYPVIVFSPGLGMPRACTQLTTRIWQAADMSWPLLIIPGWGLHRCPVTSPACIHRLGQTLRLNSVIAPRRNVTHSGNPKRFTSRLINGS